MQPKVQQTFAHIARHHLNGTSSRAAVELNPAGEVLSLAPSQHMHLPAARGWIVRALAGTVWIAQDGDIRDVVLEAGDSIVLDRDGPALFSPLNEARISLARASGRCATRDKAAASAASPSAVRPTFA